MSILVAVIVYLLLVVISAKLLWVGLIKNKRIFVIAGLLIPILFSALRKDVGTDFENYITMYNEVLGISFSEFMTTFFVEPTFYFLAQLSSFIFHSPFLFFFINSAFTVLFFYLGIRKYTENPIYIIYAFTAFLLIIFPSTMNIVRQGTALSFVFYATSYIITGQIKKYLLWVLVASLFHYSAIVMLPAYLLRYVSRFIKKDDQIIMIKILYFIFIIAGVGICGLIMLTNILPDRYAGYIMNTGAGINMMFYASALMFAGMSLILYRSKIKKNDHLIFVYLLSAVTVATLAVGFYNDDSRRIAFYFMPYLFMLIPLLVPYIKKGNMRTIYVGLAVFYPLVYFVLFYAILGYSQIFPYSWILAGGYGG